MKIGPNAEVMRNDFPIVCINLLILVHRWDADSVCSPLDQKCPLLSHRCKSHELIKITIFRKMRTDFFFPFNRVKRRIPTQAHTFLSSVKLISIDLRGREPK